MYSITNDASFQEVSTLRDKLVDITEEEDHPVVLVGNKCDLEDDRQVQKAQASSVAEKYKWTWIEASAKNKINVTETFQEIVRCIRKYRNSAVSNDTEDKATEKPTATRRRAGCLLL
jgi:GTPase SAR1 family protein